MRQSIARSTKIGALSLVRKRDQEAAQPLREQSARCGADGGEQQALGQHLTDDAAARRADGQAHRDLALARGRAREHQVGEVGAGDEQHQAGGREQQPQRRLVVAAQRGDAGRRRRTAPSLKVEVVLRVLGAVARRQRLLEDRTGDRRKLRARTLGASNPVSAGRRLPETTRRACRGRCARRARAARRRAARPRRRRGRLRRRRNSPAVHADDVVGVAVQHQAAADRGRVAAVLALPEAVADHRRRRGAAAAVVGSREDPAGQRAGRPSVLKKSPLTQRPWRSVLRRRR